MATFAIGDVHGCVRTLRALLDGCGFDPASDRVWQVGDLVNRGPSSLETLRWAKDAGDSLVTVLGNHELHLLGMAWEIDGFKKRRALAPILKAADADELIDWVSHRPLVHHEGGRLMIHAGILPGWSLDDVLEMARATEQTLRGDKAKKLLKRSRLPIALQWDHELKGMDRKAAFLRTVTTLRIVDALDDPMDAMMSPPSELSGGLSAWFERRTSSIEKLDVVFGHWATLGLWIRPGLFGLDSGCVWGGQLTAVRLEDARIYQVPLQDDVDYRS